MHFETKEAAYDFLLAQKGIEDPAVIVLGEEYIIGRWESVGALLPNLYICRVGKVAIRVFGRGPNLDSAMADALESLTRYPTKREHDASKSLLSGMQQRDGNQRGGIPVVSEPLAEK